jgi:uncharacterized 2Fe-2S/4Fe-4S cluster protein (DUF4445 family)
MADHPLVVFLPSGKRGHVTSGTTVLDAARNLGVDLDSVCGGRGMCARCQFMPTFGSFPKLGLMAREAALSPWNDVEARQDRTRGMVPGRRLGCQARILGDMVIDVPADAQVHRQVVRKDAAERSIVMDPAVRLYLVEVSEPDMRDPSGDWERVVRALDAQWGLTEPEIGLAELARLQTALRRGGWQITLALHQDHADERARVVGLWPGFFDEPVYGLAVDLGSTTIAAHLCDLSSGDVVASAGMMNPQIRFGEDLMSRVSYAMMNPDGSAEMTEAVRRALNELAQSVARDGQIDPAQIVDVTLVGNPVMHHLALGLDPSELGQAPFALAHAGALDLAARELGFTGIAANARAYVLPCIAGHVGADAAAVALSEEPYSADALTLVVDVGTNAEILLGNRERVLACSSPTGPAFEGAQISAGQRAAPGAIERVRIDPVTKQPRFRIIGCDLWSNEPGFETAIKDIGVSGICGSGIIEAVAEMRMAGIVDASGLIGSPEQTGTDRVFAQGRTHAWLLYEGPAKADGTEPLRIAVTQNDVRAIQLAKAALYAGARLLMDELVTDRVERVVLAGAFGAHISPLHAIVLGMIPDIEIDHVTSAGNAAGTGARIALCNRSARREIEAVVGRIHKVETAIEPRFQEHFIAANALPHATDPFDALRQVAPLPDVAFNLDPSRRRRRGG